MATEINLNPMAHPAASLNMGVCPCCGKYLLYEPDTNYCRWCGCRLEWFNYDDSRKIIIMMVGAPCSGKSTIGKIISEDTCVRYISSGDIARKMATKDATVEDMLMNGLTAPEDEMRSEIKSVLMENKSLVLDGFPRFNDQLSFIAEMAEAYNYSMIFVVIENTIETLIKRNASRGRDDKDNFKERMLWYMDNTVPMIYRIERDYRKLIVKQRVNGNTSLTCSKVREKCKDIIRGKI